MKKSTILLTMALLMSTAAIAQSSLNKEEKTYSSTVFCPNGDKIRIEGQCCEPGVFSCSFISCTNYTPPTVQCPGVGN